MELSSPIPHPYSASGVRGRAEFGLLPPPWADNQNAVWTFPTQFTFQRKKMNQPGQPSSRLPTPAPPLLREHTLQEVSGAARGQSPLPYPDSAPRGWALPRDVSPIKVQSKPSLPSLQARPAPGPPLWVPSGSGFWLGGMRAPGNASLLLNGRGKPASAPGGGSRGTCRPGPPPRARGRQAGRRAPPSPV